MSQDGFGAKGLQKQKFYGINVTSFGAVFFSMLHVPTVPGFPAKTWRWVVIKIGIASRVDEVLLEVDAGLFFAASAASDRSFLITFTTTFK